MQLHVTNLHVTVPTTTKYCTSGSNIPFVRSSGLFFSTLFVFCRKYFSPAHSPLLLPARFHRNQRFPTVVLKSVPFATFLYCNSRRKSLDWMRISGKYYKRDMTLPMFKKSTRAWGESIILLFSNQNFRNTPEYAIDWNVSIWQDVFQRLVYNKSVSLVTWLDLGFLI